MTNALYHIREVVGTYNNYCKKKVQRMRLGCDEVYELECEVIKRDEFKIHQ